MRILLERLSSSGEPYAGPAAGVLELALPADVHSVRSARLAVADYCVRCGVPTEVAERTVLAVSELVTNAVLHAGTPFLFCAEYDGRQVTVAVIDGTTERPSPPQPATAYHGMGIVGRLGPWGVFRTTLGKTVWATVDEARAASPAPRSVPLPTTAPLPRLPGRP